MNDTTTNSVRNENSGFEIKEVEQLAQRQADEKNKKEMERYQERLRKWESQKPEQPEHVGKNESANIPETGSKATVPILQMPNAKPERRKELEFNLTENYLLQRYEFRYNIITNESEYKGFEGQWIEISPLEFNTLYREVKKANINIRDGDLIKVLRNRITTPIYDPFIEWCNRLPEWNGEANIAEFFSQIQLTKPEYSAQYLDLFYRWFVWLVAQATLQTDRPNDAVLILCGKGGTGKSTFFRKLIPYELQKYYAPDFGDLHDKDSLRALGSTLLIVFDELSVLIGRHADDATFKKVTQLSKIRTRLPYDINTTTMPRRASLCGTVDKPQFINDDNTRRLWTIPIEAIVFSAHINDEFLVQMWAEAKQRLSEGFQCWINAKEIKILNVRNEEHQTANTIKDLLISHYVSVIPHDKGYFRTTTDILKGLSDKYTNTILSNVSVKALGSALQELFPNSRFKAWINGQSKWGYSLRFIENPIITDKAPDMPESSIVLPSQEGFFSGMHGKEQ